MKHEKKYWAAQKQCQYLTSTRLKWAHKKYQEETGKIKQNVPAPDIFFFPFFLGFANGCKESSLLSTRRRKCQAQQSVFDILFIRNYVLKTCQDRAAANRGQQWRKQIDLQRVLNCFNAANIQPVLFISPGCLGCSHGRMEVPSEDFRTSTARSPSRAQLCKHSKLDLGLLNRNKEGNPQGHCSLFKVELHFQGWPSTVISGLFEQPLENKRALKIAKMGSLAL